MISKFLLAALLAAQTGAPQPRTSFVCVPDLVTGFRFDVVGQKWTSNSFAATDRYVVAPSSRPGSAWEIKQVGHEAPVAICDEGFNKAGTLGCEGFVVFRMNRSSLRFLAAFVIGFWSDDLSKTPDPLFKEGANTPSITIGRCAPL